MSDGKTPVHYWKHLDRPGLCRLSPFQNRRHDWTWTPDQRLICRCGAEADALTGHVTKTGW